MISKEIEKKLQAAVSDWTNCDDNKVKAIIDIFNDTIDSAEDEMFEMAQAILWSQINLIYTHAQTLKQRTPNKLDMEIITELTKAISILKNYKEE